MKKMCKKMVSLLLAAVMVLTMTAFASVVYAADEESVEVDPDFKMGVILIGDVSRMAELTEALEKRASYKEVL